MRILKTKKTPRAVDGEGMQMLFWPRSVIPVANVGIRVNSASRHKLSPARDSVAERLSRPRIMI